MELTLEALGLSKEELSERVIDRMVHQCLHSTGIDYDGEFDVDTPLAKKLQKRVNDAIDAKVSELAERHVLPNVHKYIEDVVLQRTNSWGERVGEPVPFIEYLVQRAEAYLKEKVDFEGKTEEESRGYSFHSKQTRVAHLVDKHLQYSIEKAMEKALKTANSAIVEGLNETVKLKLQEVLEQLNKRGGK